MLALALTSALLLHAPPDERIQHRVEVSVTSPQVRRGRPGRVERPFRATQILDLAIGAQFPRRLSGDHVMEFKVYTPNGHLYQTLTVPFTGEWRRRSGTQRWVHGYPRPLQEEQMRELRDEGERSAGQDSPTTRYEVEARLPVAGTWIMTNSLYGRWRVDAHLDGAATIAGSAHFALEP